MMFLHPCCPSTEPLACLPTCLLGIAPPSVEAAICCMLHTLHASLRVVLSPAHSQRAACRLHRPGVFRPWRTEALRTGHGLGHQRLPAQPPLLHAPTG